MIGASYQGILVLHKRTGLNWFHSHALFRLGKIARIVIRITYARRSFGAFCTSVSEVSNRIIEKQAE